CAGIAMPGGSPGVWLESSLLSFPPQPARQSAARAILHISSPLIDRERPDGHREIEELHTRSHPLPALKAVEGLGQRPVVSGDLLTSGRPWGDGPVDPRRNDCGEQIQNRDSRTDNYRECTIRWETENRRPDRGGSREKGPCDTKRDEREPPVRHVRSAAVREISAHADALSGRQLLD